MDEQRCVLAGKEPKATSLHLQMDNPRYHTGEGHLRLAHAHQGDRGLSRVCSLGGCCGEDEDEELEGSKGELQRSLTELVGSHHMERPGEMGLFSLK